MGVSSSSSSYNANTTTTAVASTISTTSSADDDDQILAAALSAILGKEVLPNSGAQQSQTQENENKISLFDQHLTSFIYGKVGFDDKATDESLMTLHINILSTKNTFTCFVEQDAIVDKLKQIVYEREGIPCNKQNLVHCGQEIDDGHLLSEYGIQDSSTIFVVRVRSLDSNDLPTLDKDSRDAKYDYDFTRVKDQSKRFQRGGIEYCRPCGWKRYAIKVQGRYENDYWLGSNNGPDEWPVSYHGTGCDAAQSIAQIGYDLTKEKRFLYGHGIYSTPNISVAKRYAKSFTLNNNTYSVVLQNRVNPKSLIKLSANQVNDKGEYWISPNSKDIRPYGYCIIKN